MKGAILCVIGFFLFVPGARADELRLKDGTKIVGTIVGYEDNSFKVQTSYGFALVRRDQIVTILVADAEKKPAPAKKPAAIPAAAPAEQPDSPAKTAEKTSPPPKREMPPPLDTAAAVQPASVEPKPSAARPPAAAPKSATPAQASPAAAPQLVSADAPTPPKPAPEPPMREEVSGNSYTNLTYGFRMYKPPDWQVIEGARKMLPGAIVAMGTDDQATVLVVGRGPATGTLENDAATTEQELRQLYQNYRAVGEKRISVSGAPALERRFRGSVDQRDWSGVAVFLARGGQIFRIFGMTYADSDLVQIQENVIHRAIASLEFTKP